MVEVITDLGACKDTLDFIDECRHLRRELGISFRRHQKGEEFFADQVIEGAFPPEALTDAFRREGCGVNILGLSAAGMSQYRLRGIPLTLSPVPP